MRLSVTYRNVKVDVFESGDDPMLVTSQVVGGFVVIDAAGSEEKGNEKVCFLICLPKM